MYFQVLRDQESAEGKNVSLKDDVTEEELEAALAAASQEEQEQEREGPMRRRNRRFGPRRRSGGEGESRHLVNGDGMDGDEHADGEGSPPGDQRKRQNSDRRRRMRNRRRRSERQSSERERSSPQHDEDDAEYVGDERRRRRPMRFRRQRDSSKTETASGEDNEQQDDKTSPYSGGEGQRRPFRNRRPQRRSEGSKDYDSDQQDRRQPRRFTRRPRYSNRQDGEGSGDSPGQNKSGSPGGYRYLVGRRPRRRNYLPSVYVGSLPKTLRVSDFKKQIRDKDVRPLRVLWRGTNGHVFLIFQTMDETEDTLRKLENLSINDKEVKVALANRTERRRKTATPDGSGQDDELKYNDQSALRSESSDNRVENFRQDSELIS